jgi:hypothetical protein
VSETQTPSAAQPEQTVYERCDRCSSAVDEGQRYCVVCGSRNKRAEDPVSRYLAVATSRSRAAQSSRPAAARRRRASGLGTAAVIAAIPLAVALGVIVGRANSGGDAALIRALRAQKAPVVTVTGGGTASSTGQASVATRTVAGTFTLAQGYAVELRTLPVRGTGPAGVAKAEQAAKAKGATGIGVIDVNTFTVSPKPSGDVYVIYSGQFKTKSEAEAALAKLKRRFPGAVVIAVRAAAGSSSSSSRSSASGGGQVSTQATKANIAQGAKEVKQISHATGSNYVQAQNNLPGQVVIP